MLNPMPSRTISKSAFSLLELLVSLAVLAVILLLVANVVSFLLSLSSSSKSRVSIEQGTRESAGYLTRKLGRATLNSYFDYIDSAGTFRTPANANSFSPDDYRLSSDLHFIAAPASDVLNASASLFPGSAVLFQSGSGVSSTPLEGLSESLNASGFFIEFSQRTDRPSFLNGILPPEPFRYRLVEVVEPTESFSVFASTKPASGSGGYDRTWIDNLLGMRRTIIADNVVFLLVLPKLSPALEKELSGKSDGSYLAPTYLYDSRSWEKSSPDGSRADLTQNTLPPSLEVVLVSISEASARRIDNGSTPPLDGLFAGLFTDSALLHKTQNDEGDMARMETRLRDRDLDYRIARFEIPLSAARWMVP